MCTKFNLGSHEETMKKIEGSRGGSFIWRINTEKGSYAIKQLAPVIDLTDAKIISKYELSELIAYRFSQQGIPSVFAIEESDHRLTIIDDIGYLIYPWIEGYTLKRNEVSESHALKIAKIIAKIHNINLTMPVIGSPRFDILNNESIVDAIEKAVSLKFPFAKNLKEKQKILLTLNENYQKVIPTLKEHSVVTHCDLDQLNVIWDKKGEPFLLDWESAKKMNPTYEIVRTSLRFRGVGTDHFSLALYTNILRTYEKYGGLLNKNHIEAALQALSSGTINWLLYNIEIACTSEVSEEKNKACKEIEEIIMPMNITRSQALISELLKIKFD